jgi:hypothetical protein
MMITPFILALMQAQRDERPSNCPNVILYGLRQVVLVKRRLPSGRSYDMSGVLHSDYHEDVWNVMT